MPAPTQEVDSGKQPTSSFAQYEVNCYCTTAAQSPESIVRLDNNGDILLALVQGQTREQLRQQGFSFNESQIRLLEDWRLVSEKNDILRSTIPILTPDQTRQLRESMRERARVIGGETREDIGAITRELDSSGREGNAYAILFSYVLDGLVWKGFEEKGLLQQRNSAQKVLSGRGFCGPFVRHGSLRPVPIPCPMRVWR